MLCICRKVNKYEELLEAVIHKGTTQRGAQMIKRKYVEAKDSAKSLTTNNKSSEYTSQRVSSSAVTGRNDTIQYTIDYFVTTNTK